MNIELDEQDLAVFTLAIDRAVKSFGYSSEGEALFTLARKVATQVQEEQKGVTADPEGTEPKDFVYDIAKQEVA